jgi:hypothetical protein
LIFARRPVAFGRASSDGMLEKQDYVPLPRRGAREAGGEGYPSQ